MHKNTILAEDLELKVRLRLEPASGIHPMTVRLQIYYESQERWASESYWNVNSAVKGHRSIWKRFIGLSLLSGYGIEEAIEKGRKVYDKVCDEKRNSKLNIESTLEIEELLDH